MQVAAALFKDPPHQAHLTQILPGTVLDPQGLSALDLPRHETPWCLQHDERMAQRGVHPPGERVDYRYAQVVRYAACNMVLRKWGACHSAAHPFNAQELAALPCASVTATL